MVECAMRPLIAVLFLIVLVSFVLSNREPVTVGFWPTDARWDMPLSIALLIAAAVALIVGAAMMWISELRQRRRARHAETALRRLEEQVQELQAQLHAPPKN
jgi:lipopolysaccharide assembly protein A